MFLSVHVNIRKNKNVHKNEILRVQLRALNLRRQFPPPCFFLSNRDFKIRRLQTTDYGLRLDVRFLAV